jgi:hypothetical protein
MPNIIESDQINKNVGDKVDAVIAFEVVEKGDNDVVLEIKSANFNQVKRIG